MLQAVDAGKLCQASIGSDRGEETSVSLMAEAGSHVRPNSLMVGKGRPGTILAATEARIHTGPMTVMEVGKKAKKEKKSLHS